MKKILSAIMALALIMSTAAASTTTAFAGTSDSTELKNAIAAVKKVIEIPEKLSEFSYYYDEENESGSLVHMNWSDKEQSSYVSAAVTDKGVITSYYCHVPEFEGTGLAKITKTQAEKYASEYLTKLTYTPQSTFKLEDSVGSDYGQDYYFTYTMYVNGIPCDFANVRMGINKYAGKLSSYSYRSDVKDTATAEYPSKDKVITKEEAEKIYLSELGPELKYLSYYDYSKKSLKVFAAYGTDGVNRAIDAATGKIVKLYDDIIIYRDMGAKQEEAKSTSNAAGAEIKYTEEELKEIERAQNLMDKNEADKTAKNLISSIGSQTLKSVSLREDWGPNQDYVWQLNYEKHYVTLDAKTGSLISYYTSQDNDSKRDIGLEKAKNTAEGFLDKVCSDKKQQIVWTNENTIDSKYGNYDFTYTRQENGISFVDNSISVSVNKAGGEVVSYSKTWYNNATFPKLDGVIDKAKSFRIADELGNYDLIYKKDSEGKIALVYDFKKDNTYIIDAFKGIRLDYTGEAYKEANGAEYTDISGNWAEKIITELKNNGYYLEGDKFAPKAATTQIEFFKYLYSPEQSYYRDNDDFYKMLLANNVITKEEINPNAKVTRQEAAKFISRYLGVGKLAKESSIFKNMYTDKVEPSYLGYASAAYALGIMKGDAKGRFNGTGTLTHAETAVVIYNTLNNK
ncbi:S-layer homology domain-containing protein [Aminipila sp.]|uniref:S-layer homology domain-containing protein n=2 Tax=Aminipila sp. TaxID=2060095 RepID=UPI00289AB25E|nr:S-layer homology domain-containing protein [Aminipila sp.]